jgi:UDP-glucuronate decarboxylase
VRSCYDEGKRTAETLTMDYHRGASLEVRIARIFNTYGPRMCIDDGRVVSNFVAQVITRLRNSFTHMHRSPACY